MEVHFKRGVQAKLDQMARESGRPSNELLEDAVVCYFDEVAHSTRGKCSTGALTIWKAAE